MLDCEYVFSSVSQHVYNYVLYVFQASIYEQVRLYLSTCVCSSDNSLWLNMCECESMIEHVRFVIMCVYMVVCECMNMPMILCECAVWVDVLAH